MWFELMIALAGVFAFTTSNALRYRMMLSYAKEKISVLGAMMVHHTVKFAIVFTPLKVGVMAKPFATKAVSGIPVRKSSPMILFEQVFELGWQALLLPFLLIYMGSGELFGSITMLVLLLAVAAAAFVAGCLKRGSLVSFVISLAKRFPERIKNYGRKSGLGRDGIRDMIEDSSGYFRDWRLIARILPFTVFQLLLWPYSLQMTAASMSIPLPYGIAFIAGWASVAIGRLSGLPGGFVATELSMAGVLVFFGVDAMAAAGLSVLFRIVTLVPFIIIGIPSSIAIGAMSFRKKKS